MKKKIFSKDILYNLYVKKGMRISEVAKELSCCTQIVRKNLIMYDIKIRNDKKGKNNPNFRNGNYLNKMYYCIEEGCNNIVRSGNRKCKEHANLSRSKRMTGKNNPNYGNPKNMKGTNHPRYKNGLFFNKNFCPDCGKEIHPYAKYCYIHANIGERNPNFIDGRSNFPYPLEFNKQLKSEIRERDNYTCQLCGIKEKDYNKNLDVHHIDYNRQNSNKNNLITLCNLCNNHVNKNRKKWIKYFKNLLEGGEK